MACNHLNRRWNGSHALLVTFWRHADVASSRQQEVAFGTIRILTCTCRVTLLSFCLLSRHFSTYTSLRRLRQPVRNRPFPSWKTGSCAVGPCQHLH